MMVRLLLAVVPWLLSFPCHALPAGLGSALRRSVSSPSSSSALRALSPLAQDVASSVFSIGASAAWLQIWITLAKSGKIDTKLSRKIIHTGSAPLFACLWPLYSSGDLPSRAVASLVPLAQMIRLASSGITSANKLVKDNENGSRASSGSNDKNVSDGGLANAVSRTGDKSEVFGGPLIYVVVLFFSTLVGFRASPVGVVAVCQMAAGDGLADIVGRRFGRDKWPFSTTKSYAGSAAFVVGAFVVSTGVLSLLAATGCLALDVTAYLPQLLAISVACAAVELVPISDDNITVPVAGAVLAALLLR